MTTLLVGGTGFLGSFVATRLAARGDLVVLVRRSSERSVLPPGVEVRVGDLGDLQGVRARLHGITRVVFCASMGFGHVPPFVRLLEEARIRRTVWVSTTALFTTLPASSKLVRVEAERAVRAASFDWTILRPTMIYGTERDRNVARLLYFLRRSPLYPLVGDGRALHQPIYVEDLADAVVRALGEPATRGRDYNLAGAAPLSYARLVCTAAGALGKRVRLVHVPPPVALAGARLLARLPRSISRPITPEQVLRLGEDKTFDWRPAATDFGFTTRTFAEGVKLEALRLGLAPVRSR